jgi:hypothetical protein
MRGPSIGVTGGFLAEAGGLCLRRRIDVPLRRRALIALLVLASVAVGMQDAPGQPWSSGLRGASLAVCPGPGTGTGPMPHNFQALVPGPDNRFNLTKPVCVVCTWLNADRSQTARYRTVPAPGYLIQAIQQFNATKVNNPGSIDVHAMSRLAQAEENTCDGVTQAGCTSLGPGDAPPHRVAGAQPSPITRRDPPNQGCYALQPGRYQAYKRGYNGATLVATRVVTIVATSPGRYLLTTPDGTYPLAQTQLVENGAQYVANAVRRTGQTAWQPLRPPFFVRFVRQVNDTSATKYDVYFSNGPQMPGPLSSETWVRL